jgi:hypothetical protein
MVYYIFKQNAIGNGKHMLNITPEYSILLETEIYPCSCVGSCCRMNDEWEPMWKEAVVA